MKYLIILSFIATAANAQNVQFVMNELCPSQNGYANIESKSGSFSHVYAWVRSTGHTYDLVPADNSGEKWILPNECADKVILLYGESRGRRCCSGFLNTNIPTAVSKSCLRTLPEMHNCNFYPNPVTSGIVFVYHLDAQSDLTIIHASTGERVQVTNLGNTIDVRHLHPGAYLVNYSSGGKKMIEKLIVK